VFRYAQATGISITVISALAKAEKGRQQRSFEPSCGLGVAANQASVGKTKSSSPQPIQVLRLIIGLHDAGINKVKPYLELWHIQSTHHIYLRRMDSEVQYGWALLMRSFVFRATFLTSNAHQEFNCYFWMKHCRLEMRRMCLLHVVGRSRRHRMKSVGDLGGSLGSGRFHQPFCELCQRDMLADK
jgi:hypothetical protein